MCMSHWCDLGERATGGFNAPLRICHASTVEQATAVLREGAVIGSDPEGTSGHNFPQASAYYKQKRKAIHPRRRSKATLRGCSRRDEDLMMASPKPGRLAFSAAKIIPRQ